MHGSDEVVVDLVHALADADGVAPDETDYRLAEYVNPDVLTKLARSEESTWTFTFQVSDHQVTLTSDGQVFIDGVLQRDNCLTRE